MRNMKIIFGENLQHSPQAQNIWGGKAEKLKMFLNRKTHRLPKLICKFNNIPKKLLIGY